MATAEWKVANQDRLRAYRRKHYHDNAEYYKAKTNARRRKLARWYKAFRKTLKCSRCSENDPVCIDLHHVNPKKKSVTPAKIRMTGWSMKRVLDEIAKCIPLCANCHRKEHMRVVQRLRRRSPKS